MTRLKTTNTVPRSWELVLQIGLDMMDESAAIWSCSPAAFDFPLFAHLHQHTPSSSNVIHDPSSTRLNAIPPEPEISTARRRRPAEFEFHKTITDRRTDHEPCSRILPPVSSTVHFMTRKSIFTPVRVSGWSENGRFTRCCTNHGVCLNTSLLVLIFETQHPINSRFGERYILWQSCGRFSSPTTVAHSLSRCFSFAVFSSHSLLLSFRS